jgi:hypothetical protein
MNLRLRWAAPWLAVIAVVQLGLPWTEEAYAQAGGQVGTVTAVAGEASVLRFGATSPEGLATGATLFEGDEVRTEDGRARIQLNDGSILQLGESTSLMLTWVLHAPALETQSVILSVPTGIVRTIVEALLPRSLFELRTSTAITSERGTDFIAEAELDNTAVVALEGTVEVQNGSRAIAGRVTLGPGEGTDVRSAEPPGTPVRWGEARRSDFITRTTVPDR